MCAHDRAQLSLLHPQGHPTRRRGREGGGRLEGGEEERERGRATRLGSQRPLAISGSSAGPTGRARCVWATATSGAAPCCQ